MSTNQKLAQALIAESMAIPGHQPIQPRCQARQNMAEAQMSPRRRKGGQRGSGRARERRSQSLGSTQPAPTEGSHSHPRPSLPGRLPPAGSQPPKPSLPTYPSQGRGGGASLHVHSAHSLKKPWHLPRKGPGHLRVASPETTGGPNVPSRCPGGTPQVPTFS